VVGRFLGEDEGAGGSEREAGELASGLELGKEDGDESALAGFPLAGEERDGTPGQEAVPEPGSVRGCQAGEGLGAPKDGGESGHKKISISHGSTRMKRGSDPQISQIERERTPVVLNLRDRWNRWSSCRTGFHSRCQRVPERDSE